MWSDVFTWTAPKILDEENQSMIKKNHANHVAKKSTITSLSPAAVNSPLRLSLEISRTGIIQSDWEQRKILKCRIFEWLIDISLLLYCFFFIAGQEKEEEEDDGWETNKQARTNDES